MDFASKTDKAFVVDLNEEKVDQDYFSEVENITVSLLPITLNKENYRINKSDKVKLISLKAKPKDSDGISIPLYDISKNTQIKTLIVENGKIKMRSI